MLVLSRKADESITVGHDVSIKVLEIRGDLVRLGITAPTSVAVHRQEIYELLLGQAAEMVAAQLGDDCAAERVIQQSVSDGELRSVLRSTMDARTSFHKEDLRDD